MIAVSTPHPANTPQNKRKFVAWRLRLAKGARDATNAELENAEKWIENAEIAFGAMVFFGVALEVFIAAYNPPYGDPMERWGSAVADAFVALGLLGEVMAGARGRVMQGELTRRSNEKLSSAYLLAVMADTGAENASAGANLALSELAKANLGLAEAIERASQADLRRAELEFSLQPRMTDQAQFNLIQSLSGKIEEVSIIHEIDAETCWYALSLRDAFFAAGIRVGMYPRAPDVHSFGIFVYDPEMRGAKMSEVGQTLVDLFRGETIGMIVISGLPTDVTAPSEHPAIIVGGRFIVPPAHFAKFLKGGP